MKGPRESAVLRPFAALRPAADKPHLVATRSYLSYSDYELRDKLEHNPYSYLHVIHPAGMKDDEWSEPTAKFSAVRSALEDFVARGWLVADEAPHLYVYRQAFDGHVCTGVVGIAGVDVDRAGAKPGGIRVHESTLRAREELFATYLTHVGVNAEPALLAFHSNADTTSALATVTAGRPCSDFSTVDGVRHTLWTPNPAEESTLLTAIGGWGDLYVADGHHRLASSKLVAERNPKAVHAHGFMAYCVPHTDLVVKGFHRVVKSEDLPDVNVLISRIEQLGVKVCDITDEAGEVQADCGPRKAREMDWYAGLDTSGRPRILRLSIPGEDPVPSWLNNHFLAPLVGIVEPRDDNRLSYLGGDASPAEIRKAAAAADTWVFALEAMTFDDLARVADRDGVLPPKSTWIAPKLRSGLLLFDFKPLNAV